jgi:hypothetical protein
MNRYFCNAFFGFVNKAHVDMLEEVELIVNPQQWNNKWIS